MFGKDRHAPLSRLKMPETCHETLYDLLNSETVAGLTAGQRSYSESQRSNMSCQISVIADSAIG